MVDRGRRPYCPGWEGTGLGPGHGYRTQAIWAPRESGTQGHMTWNIRQKHRLRGKQHADGWARSHRPRGHPATAMLDACTYWEDVALQNAWEPQRTRPDHRAQGTTGSSPFGTNTLESRGGGVAAQRPQAAPRPRLGPPSPDLVRLPHLVEQLHHLVVDDEHDGHVQAHPAQAGDRALVEPAEVWGWGGGGREEKG